MDTQLEPYFPPHPSAPRRGKRPLGQVKATVAAKGAYRFNKNNPDIKLTDAEKSLILKTFNENLWKACVDNRNGVILPERMGKFEIFSYQASRKKLKINKYMSEKLGVEIHTNPVLRGDGRKSFVDFQVSSDSFNMKNKELWGFLPVKDFTRAKNEAFEKSRGKYKGDVKNRAAYYRKDKFYKQFFAMEMDAELLKTYNEFDFS